MKSLRISKIVAYRLLAGGLIVLGVLTSPTMAQDRGELKIEGTHIARLVLHGGDDGHTEEWTKLSGTLSLPVGTYRVQRLELSNGSACQSQGLVDLGPIEITKDEPAVLKAGGPLQQMIECRRQGYILLLSYSLRGIGNEPYSPPSRPDQRAKFTVYQGDKEIASGAFEYG